jgi:hypothetical protein
LPASSTAAQKLVVGQETETMLLGESMARGADHDEPL